MKKIIEALERLVDESGIIVEVTERELEEYASGTRMWWKVKNSLKEAKSDLRRFESLLELAKEDEKENKTAGIKTTKLDFKVEDSPKLCYSNYRVMLILNKKTDYIVPFFWTPELGVDNSHRALWNYAMWSETDDGQPIYNISHRWGGFYTYGLGNGGQKQLTLYGESSDYPHNLDAKAVKECFLKGMKFSEYMEKYFASDLVFG